jgi:hypothetical protein
VVIDLLRHDRDDFRRQLGQKYSGFDPNELNRMLKAAGLAEASIRPLPPDPNVKGPALFIAHAIK